jgi:hypothetical protein
MQLLQAVDLPELRKRAFANAPLLCSRSNEANFSVGSFVKKEV